MADTSSKPPLVFLHGWTMRGEVFSDVIEQLAADYDCHAPDLPGHGKIADGFEISIDGAADSVAAYIAKHHLESPVIIGWSLGAMVAWNLRRRYPDLELAGIVAIDMSPKIVNSDGWSLGIRHFDRARSEKALAVMCADWPAYAARVNAGMYAADTNTPHPQTLAIIRAQNPQDMAQMWASLAKADERETLGSLSLPMLVVKGGKSRIYPPETGRFIVETAQSAELVRMENSGHAPHLEEPELFVAVLREWLDGVPGRQ